MTRQTTDKDVEDPNSVEVSQTQAYNALHSGTAEYESFSSAWGNSRLDHTLGRETNLSKF